MIVDYLCCHFSATILFLAAACFADAAALPLRHAAFIFFSFFAFAFRRRHAVYFFAFALPRRCHALDADARCCHAALRHAALPSYD